MFVQQYLVLLRRRIITSSTRGNTALFSTNATPIKAISTCCCTRKNSDIFSVGSTMNCRGSRRFHSSFSSSLSSKLALKSSSTSSMSTSTSSSMAFSSQSTSSSKKDLLLYAWGTDADGSLLLSNNKKSDDDSSGEEVSQVKVGDKADIPTRVENWRNQLSEYDDNDSNDSPIKSIVAGPASTGIVLENGNCYVCGQNKLGQLGLGNNDPSITKLHLLGNKDVQSLALGENFSAYINNEGDLYTFGFGGSTFQGFGVLGLGNNIGSYNTPQLVTSLIEDGCYAKQVEVGSMHMTVLTTEGEVLACGSGSYGKLGNFDTDDQLYLEPVETLSSGVSKITSGKSFTIALMEDGTLYGWGRNDKFQIGTGYGLSVDMYAMEPIPSEITTCDELAGREVVDVDAGRNHAACVTKKGELFIWGSSLYMEPTCVNELLHTKIVKVSCGHDYTLAVADDGIVYSFGTTGKKGVLGQGPSIKKLNQPQKIETLEDIGKVHDIVAGWDRAFAFVESHNE